MVFVGREALPLFRSAKADLLTNAPLPAASAEVLPRLVGIDEYETYAYRLNSTGTVQLIRLSDSQPWTNLPALSLQKHPASPAIFAHRGRGPFALLRLRPRAEEREAVDS
ncbi:MAG TPA: hypothetical protein VK530_08100 [Candidatus Acidoferrum sp.]|nr:hypothetical protein [Candidatus Acidoferrum sp.]